MPEPPKHSILYVDDEPGLLEIAKIFLEKTENLTVDTDVSAGNALTILSSKSYDAIISDYQMPDMDGIAFLKAVRERFGDIPFILFTGKGREDVVIDAINNGADFYLQKGGDAKAQFAELAHKVRQAVRRKEAERSVLDSERRLSDIIDFLPDATFVIDRGGRVIAWNRAIEEMTGVSAAEILMKGNYEYALPFYGARRPILVDLIAAPDAEVQQYYSPVQREGASLIGETSLVRLKGETISVLAKACPLYNKAGDIAGAIESIRDITGRKQAEDELRAAYEQIAATEEELREQFDELARSERDLRKSENAITGIFHAAPVGIAVVTDRTLVRVNEHLCRMTGYPREELEGKNTRFLYADDAEFRRAGRFYRSPGGKDPTGTIETRFACKDGTIRNIQLYGTAIDPSGPAAGMIFTALDITEEKRERGERVAAREKLSLAKVALHAQYDKLALSEQQTRESEAKYRSIFESIQDMVYRTDRQGMITMINPSGAKLFGYASPEEMIGLDIARDLYTNPKDREQLLAILARDGVVSNYPVTAKSRQGTPIWLVVNSHFYRDGDGKVLGVEGILHDVTQLRHTEKALREANRKLNLLSGITRHDIVNQLAVLRGFVRLAWLRESDPAIEDFLSKIEEVGETIARQVEFTKEYQELGVHAPRWQSLEKILGEVRPDGTRFLSACHAIEVFADPMLERVFYNLLDNSLRHGEEVTGIRVSTREDGGDLRILWEDDGIGIPDGVKEKIFERGYGEHTGLGLFLAREILSITGMTITETGEYGKGARFEISVPGGSWRAEGLQNPGGFSVRSGDRIPDRDWPFP